MHRITVMSYSDRISWPIAQAVINLVVWLTGFYVSMLYYSPLNSLASSQDLLQWTSFLRMLSGFGVFILDKP